MEAQLMSHQGRSYSRESSAHPLQFRLTTRGTMWRPRRGLLYNCPASDAFDAAPARPGRRSASAWQINRAEAPGTTSHIGGPALIFIK